MKQMYMGDFFKYEEVGMYYPNNHIRCFNDSIENGFPEMYHYKINSSTQNTFPILKKPAKRCLIIKVCFKYLTRNWVELTIKNESIKCLFRFTKVEPLETIPGTNEILISRWDFIQHPRTSVTFLQVCAPIGILSVPEDHTLKVSVSNMNHRNTGKVFP